MVEVVKDAGKIVTGEESKVKMLQEGKRDSVFVDKSEWLSFVEKKLNNDYAKQLFISYKYIIIYYIFYR